MLALGFQVFRLRTPLGVHIGRRGAQDLKEFLAAFPEARGRLTFTDDLAAYAAVLPEGAHFTSKMLIQNLESLNVNIRHQLARRTRCATKCSRMGYLSALLFMTKHNDKIFG